MALQIGAGIGDAARSVAEVAQAHGCHRRPHTASSSLRRSGAGRAATHTCARNRRHPPRQAPVGTVRGDRAAGAGRAVRNRIRRPGRGSGPARATRSSPSAPTCVDGIGMSLPRPLGQRINGWQRRRASSSCSTPLRAGIRLLDKRSGAERGNKGSAIGAGVYGVRLDRHGLE